MRARKTFSRWDATASAGLTVFECDTSKQLYIGSSIWATRDGKDETERMKKYVEEKWAALALSLVGVAVRPSGGVRG